MKLIFEEYGKTIIAIVVAAAVLGIIFGGVNLLGVLGDQADVKSELSHKKSEEALKVVSERPKPVFIIENDENLRISQTKLFCPAGAVACYGVDEDGGMTVPITPEILSIIHIDGRGNKTEFIDNYNQEEDLVVLNASHYNASHLVCSTGETLSPGNYNLTGTVVVEYRATDDFNVYSTEKISFVVDVK